MGQGGPARARPACLCPALSPTILPQPAHPPTPPVSRGAQYLRGLGRVRLGEEHEGGPRQRLEAVQVKGVSLHDLDACVEGQRFLFWQGQGRAGACLAPSCCWGRMHVNADQPRQPLFLPLLPN